MTQSNLSVSVKVIPKSFDTCLIQPSVVALNQCVGNKWNCFKVTQVLGGPTQILIWEYEIGKSRTR